MTKDKIDSSLDKYGLEIEKHDHLFASAIRDDGLYSFRELERRFGAVQPPFQFVDEKSSDRSQDDEYLYSNDRQDGK